MNQETIVKLNELLEEYYASEDPFEQTDLAIEIIQEHVGPLLRINEELISEIEELKTLVARYKGEVEELGMLLDGDY